MAAQGKGALIDEIMATELGAYELARVSIEGPKIVLYPKLALSMALVVHELATNAANHGSLSSPSGRVLIRWHLSPAPSDTAPRTTTLSVEWHESGGPAVSTPAIRGFGLRLLAVALEPFNGTVQPVFEPARLVCRMTVPLSADAGPSGDEQPETLRLGDRSGPSLAPGNPYGQITGASS